MPYGLGDVRLARNDEMAGENGVRVDLDVVAAALAALELEVELLRRTMLHAQEAGALAEGFLVYLGGAGDDAAGVELQLGLQAADVDGADLHRL